METTVGRIWCSGATHHWKHGKNKVPLRNFQYCLESSATVSNQLNAYGKALFYCKSRSSKAGSYHQHTLNTSALFEAFIFLDELNSPIFNITSSGTGCHFWFRIRFLVGFEKANSWTVCTQLEDPKRDHLYSIATNTLDRTVLVFLTGSVRKFFHIYPKKLDHAMHLNEVEPFIEEIGREDPATFVYLMKRKYGYPPRGG